MMAVTMCFSPLHYPPICSADLGHVDAGEVWMARIRNHVMPPRAPGQPLQPSHTASDDEMLAAYHMFMSLPFPETAWKLGGVIDVVAPNDPVLLRQIREDFAKSIRRPECN